MGLGGGGGVGVGVGVGEGVGVGVVLPEEDPEPEAVVAGGVPLVVALEGAAVIPQPVIQALARASTAILPIAGELNLMGGPRVGGGPTARSHYAGIYSGCIRRE